MTRAKTKAPQAEVAAAVTHDPATTAVFDERPGESTEDRMARLKKESVKFLFETHLSNPFHPGEIKWKAQTVKNNRALAVAYIDARLVCDRLDEVAGVDGWRDEYEVLADGCVLCRLTILTPYSFWITKCDVGAPSEQPDHGDRLKAAFSDALKRAAIKFGIGRYLYRIPHAWVDYDPVKKKLNGLPQLPHWALPKKDLPDARPYYEPSEYDEPEVNPVEAHKQACADAVRLAGPAAAVSGNGKAREYPLPNKDMRPIPNQNGVQERHEEVDPKDEAKKKKTDAEKAAKAQAKSREDFVSNRLIWWIKSMDGCESPEQLTQLITENLGDEASQAKVAVWERIQKEIRDRNWIWYKDQKCVMDPNAPSEAIPY